MKGKSPPTEGEVAANGVGSRRQRMGSRRQPMVSRRGRTARSAARVSAENLVLAAGGLRVKASRQSRSQDRESTQVPVAIGKGFDGQHRRDGQGRARARY